MVDTLSARLALFFIFPPFLARLPHWAGRQGAGVPPLSSALALAVIAAGAFPAALALALVAAGAFVAASAALAAVALFVFAFCHFRLLFSS
jgi:hypothetical protein